MTYNEHQRAVARQQKAIEKAQTEATVRAGGPRWTDKDTAKIKELLNRPLESWL
jgi:hypothetical protein